MFNQCYWYLKLISNIPNNVLQLFLLFWWHYRHVLCPVSFVDITARGFPHAVSCTLQPSVKDCTLVILQFGKTTLQYFGQPTVQYFGQTTVQYFGPTTVQYFGQTKYYSTLTRLQYSPWSDYSIVLWPDYSKVLWSSYSTVILPDYHM